MVQILPHRYIVTVLGHVYTTGLHSKSYKHNAENIYL